MPETVLDLIHKAVAGDHHAFARLVDRYGGSVYRRVARQVSDRDDADDLVQDIFITAFTKLNQIRDHHKFAGWLHAIADNVVRMWHRRVYTQLRWEEMFEADHRSSESSDDATILHITLKKALAKLPEAQRQVVEHHYLSGYSYLDTAGLLGIHVNTVRSRLQKARKKLKREVDDMSESQTKVQKVPLSKNDITIMRWATQIVSKDPDRAGLGGLYLDPVGKIVATDGHRMMEWSTESLKHLDAPKLVGAWYNINIPDVDRASFNLDSRGTTLKIKNKRNIPLSLLDEQNYPNYPAVIPASWLVNAELATTGLLSLISLMPDHLGPRHPIDPEDTWEYDPVVEIRLSMAEQTLSLLTTRDMGYSRRQGDETEIPLYNPTADWTFTASMPAEIKSDSVDDRFKIWVDYAYLKTCIQILNDIGTQSITARFNAVDTAMVFESIDVDTCRMLQMPIRMLTHEDEVRQAG